MCKCRVTIDTNVFVQMFNWGCDAGRDQHIVQLFAQLVAQGAHILLDSEGKVAAEYTKHVEPLTRIDDKPIWQAVVRAVLALTPMHIALKGHQPVIDALEDAMAGAKNAHDRVFVAVAALGEGTLISNDEDDICGRRPEIKKSLKKLKANYKNIHKVRILTSVEARDEYCAQ